MSIRKILIFIIALMAVLCVSAQAETTVALNDSGYTITAPGAYRISGTSAAGNIVVNAPGANVTILLNGVNIAANNGAAIDIQAAAKCTIILVDVSENMLRAQKDSYAGLANHGVPLIITCEHAANTKHVCSDLCGKLTAKSSLDGYAAGIGGDDQSNGSNITISGGNITATGSNFGGAGIGGGDDGNGSNITITGGNVVAIGGTDAGSGNCNSAGIGGGCRGRGNNITITGGTVTATGSAGGGAGIGGGWMDNGENITITGGTVTATGGERAAGIGGGWMGNGRGITITGGTVIATGGEYGAGIGGGKDLDGSWGNGTNITITGGTVTATGGFCAAGIGGGYDGDGENIIITGGTVSATSGNFATGIGGGYPGNSSNILIKPEKNTKISVLAGDNSGSAVEISNSPFTAETNITYSIDGLQYVKTSSIANNPAVPATGDGANLILWSALIAISMIGMIAVLRRKKEA